MTSAGTREREEEKKREKQSAGCNFPTFHFSSMLGDWCAVMKMKKLASKSHSKLSETRKTRSERQHWCRKENEMRKRAMEGKIEIRRNRFKALEESTEKRVEKVSPASSILICTTNATPILTLKINIPKKFMSL
jgi:hypothetical protein